MMWSADIMWSKSFVLHPVMFILYYFAIKFDKFVTDYFSLIKRTPYSLAVTVVTVNRLASGRRDSLPPRKV